MSAWVLLGRAVLMASVLYVAFIAGDYFAWTDVDGGLQYADRAAVGALFGVPFYFVLAWSSQRFLAWRRTRKASNALPREQ